MATRTAHGTLTGSAVTTVTLAIAGRRRGMRIQRRDAGGTLTAPMFWSWGTASADVPVPTTSGGDGVYCLTAANPIDVLNDEVQADNLIVKLISTDAVDYSVETW